MGVVTNFNRKENESRLLLGVVINFNRKENEARWILGVVNDFNRKENDVTPDLCVVNNFNGNDGYFTWRRTWKNLTNVARHVCSVSIGLRLMLLRCCPSPNTFSTD